ncbi:MAG: hypothetical protein AAF950_16305 [Pseudomonadota bacterium]
MASEAAKAAKNAGSNDLIELVRENAACRPPSPSSDLLGDQNNQAQVTDWIACDPPQLAFFRLRRVGVELLIDLLIDTQQGAGAQHNNQIEIVVKRQRAKALMAWLRSLFGKQQNGANAIHHHLAEFYVSTDPVNVDGTLIIDFGNSASTMAFRKTGQGPTDIQPFELNNPWDINFFERTSEDFQMMRSNVLVLRAGHEQEQSWFIMGHRADEMIQNNPSATFIYSPKKYVREWEDPTRQPRTYFRDVKGRERRQHYEKARFVNHAVEQLLQMALSSLCNPKCESNAPEMYPQINRLGVTYPLTWRENDRELFHKIVSETADSLLDLQPKVREEFQVEMVCSEPVAVAAFVIWETFYQFEQDLSLAAASLGATSGQPHLNLLVVDIGGGSTDIASVEVSWRSHDDAKTVDVYFKMVESMRFNRAGDRLSHILAVVIREYLVEKYGIDISMAFDGGEEDQAFTPAYRRQAISIIFDLTEDMKRTLAEPEGGEWILDEVGESLLLQAFEPLRMSGRMRDQPATGRLRVTHAMLEKWVQKDVQSRLTNHEPGFKDIFFYLKELTENLRKQRRAPDLVVLSGRTTRMPFIRNLTARYVELPLHRVRRLDDIVSPALLEETRPNLDKFAVVCGAHYFRSGDQIRFIAQPDAKIFNRYIGTLRSTRHGPRMLHTLITPGQTAPHTVMVQVPPKVEVRLCTAFREDGAAQIMANLRNDGSDELDVELDVFDDHTIRLKSGTSDQISFYEWIPGGVDVMADNFNDTGRIDEEPRKPDKRTDGVLTRIVRADGLEWMDNE